MNTTRLAWAAVLLASAAALAQPATAPKKDQPTPTPQPAPSKPAKPTEPTKQSSAVTPVARDKDEGWVKRNESFNTRAKQGAAAGDIGVIFLGDSITQGWEGEGKDVWQKSYAKRHAVNFGISGDRTQHVLWRLDHGNVDGLAKPSKGEAPKLVVLMIGTNNSGDNTAEEIADGVKGVVAKLRDKLPTTKVLLLAIFPRSATADTLREKNAKASQLASSCADGKMVHYLDIGAKFLEKDGSISKEIMPDSLHLSTKGYQIWADAIEPKMKELFGEGDVAPKTPAPTPPPKGG